MKDVELYRSNKPRVIDYVNKNGLDSLAYFCSTTQFCLLIAYVYVMEDFSEHREECERKIKVLKEFYGY